MAASTCDRFAGTPASRITGRLALPRARVQAEAMGLHLIKLCVGVETISELEEWIERRVRKTGRHAHVTRMTPKRAADLLAGGSLYWVIRGVVQVRQRLLDIRAVTHEDGTGACALVLESELVPTVPQPRRPFQGWRYLDPKEAPADLAGRTSSDMPPELVRELAALGLL